MANENTLPTEELYEAIRTGDLELARKAISRGADLTSILHGISYTPLGWATYSGLPDILEALVNAGAPVPIDALKPLGDEDMTDWKIQSDKEEEAYARVAQILIAHGASPDFNAYDGQPLIESFPEKFYPILHRVLSEALGRSNTHVIDPTSAPDEMDDIVIDGNEVRGTWSTCAAKIRLNPVRYLWSKDETRPFFQMWLVFAAGMILSFFLRWWIFAGIMAVLVLPLSFLLFWIFRRVAEIFHSAALTAGMVVSQNPLEFISIANMDTGVGESAYAVKRVAIRRLPCHSKAEGTHFPCVSGFQKGPAIERWGDFDPQPLSFGTGNVKLIQARKNKLGDEAFAQLQKIYERGDYPKKPGQLIWVNEDHDQKSPPILPNQP
jgi:Protein of unknown function (DUF3239)